MGALEPGSAQVYGPPLGERDLVLGVAAGHAGRVPAPPAPSLCFQLGQDRRGRMPGARLRA